MTPGFDRSLLLPLLHIIPGERERERDRARDKQWSGERGRERKRGGRGRGQTERETIARKINGSNDE